MTTTETQKIVSSYNARIAKKRIANQQNALAAFVSRKASIDAMLEHLTKISAEHFCVSPDEVTWADAGTLAHVEEQLVEICRFVDSAK